MTDPIVELASMLDSGTASGEIMGTAAGASSGGQVQVTLRVYDAADPANPLRTADGADHLLLSPVEVVID